MTAVEKMREAGLGELAIQVFQKNIDAVRRGDGGYVRETDIAPLTSIPRFDGEGGAGSAISQTAVIKLNGGLGTSMGLEDAKSLLPVTPDRTFLDIIVSQVQAVRQQYAVDLPLIFMNSFRTDASTRAYVAKYEDLPVDNLPLSFVQNRVPKLLQDDLSPVEWPADPDMEWCPPGHGDLFTALPESGLLKALRDRGYRYVIVSNSDNLGATPDPALAEWFAASGAPIAMEVCKRSAADKKGGHLAVRNGEIILREIGQTAPEDLESFQNIERHSYFNTNTLWIDLEALAVELGRRNGYLGLPVIRNAKTVDPTDPSSPAVYQLETGMGSAIEVFAGSQAIEVGRNRFRPVKTTNDLLLLRSDIYDIGDDGTVKQQVETVPLISLDPQYFGLIKDFDERCAEIPSLRNVSRLTVTGDYTLTADLKLSGDVTLPEGKLPQGE